MLYYTVSFHSYILSNILIRSAEDSTMSFNSTGRLTTLVSLGAFPNDCRFQNPHFNQLYMLFKLFRSVNSLPRAGRKPKLSPSGERKLLRMFTNKTEPIKAQDISPGWFWSQVLWIDLWTTMESLITCSVYSDKQTWDIFCLKAKWWYKSMYDRFILTTFNELINRALYSPSVVNV